MKITILPHAEKELNVHYLLIQYSLASSVSQPIFAKINLIFYQQNINQSPYEFCPDYSHQ